MFCWPKKKIIYLDSILKKRGGPNQLLPAHSPIIGRMAVFGRTESRHTVYLLLVIKHFAPFFFFLMKRGHDIIHIHLVPFFLNRRLCGILSLRKIVSWSSLFKTHTEIPYVCGKLIFRFFFYHSYALKLLKIALLSLNWVFFVISLFFGFFQQIWLY